MNQLSSSADGCMDSFLEMIGDQEIPAELPGIEIASEWTDGYMAKIYNTIPEGIYANGFQGTCFWSETDIIGRFCTIAIAADDDFKLLTHDVSYYFTNLDP